MIDAYIKNVLLCLAVEHGLYNKVSVFWVVPMRFFFFFFVENPDPKVKFISQKIKDYKASRVTRGAISLGQDSIQTCSSLPYRAFLARK